MESGEKTSRRFIKDKVKLLFAEMTIILGGIMIIWGWLFGHYIEEIQMAIGAIVVIIGHVGRFIIKLQSVGDTDHNR